MRKLLLLHVLLLFVSLSFYPTLAVSDGYMCRDASGKYAYTNIKEETNGRDCKLARRDSPESTPAETPSPSAPTTSALEPGSTSSSAIAVPLQKQGGTFVVPVHINNAITLNFIVDSGAADVSIPSDVVTTLMRTGTLKRTDFLERRTYILADGTKVPSETFRIRSMKVGNRVVENVTGSVASVQGSLLLGQSFLGRFKGWSIDNTKHVLLLE